MIIPYPRRNKTTMYDIIENPLDLIVQVKQRLEEVLDYAQDEYHPEFETFREYLEDRLDGCFPLLSELREIVENSNNTSNTDNYTGISNEDEDDGNEPHHGY